MSSKSQQKWIVKDSEGRIFGPFSIEQIHAQIDGGYFLGGELVATYPGGGWVPISRAIEFSDRLLDVLAAEAKPRQLSSAEPAPSEPPADEEISSDESPEEQIEENAEAEVPPEPMAFESPPTAPTPPSSLPYLQSSSSVGIRTDMPSSVSQIAQPLKDQGPVIELTDLKSLEQKERMKSSRLPMLFILIALVLTGVALLLPDENASGDGHIRLLSPRKNQPELPEAKLKEKFTRAFGAFQSDTFSGYIKAQNELVEVLEGSPADPSYATKKAGVVSMLCLVYRELWPFTRQDSQDMRAVSTATQEAKRLDPGGHNGATCEIVQLLVNARMGNAQGLVESMLVEESQAPVLFEIRGDIYSYHRDPANAAIYFGQARVLWPKWQKPIVQEARARAELKQYSQAMQLYKSVVDAVPEHAVARIEWGAIEALHFSQYDKGFELIKSALDGKERVSRPVEAQAYYTMAVVLMKRNQNSKALEYARKAYALNASNVEIKNLIVSLAGEAELKNTKVEGRELMYLGEQYVRSGDCFSAQAEFKAAFEAEPRNAVAAMKAGKCLWELNQSLEAIEWMRRAINSDPKLTAAYVELADYYAQRFDYMAATQTLQKIQHIAPQSYEVYRGFALIELRRNNFQGAVTYGQRALKLYETDLETFLIMAKANLGLQNHQEAQRFAGKAIELDFNRTEGHTLYGKIEAGLHGVDAGAQYMQQQIDRYVINKGQQVPQAAIDYRIALGEIYMQDERLGQAEDAFRQAISLDPNNKKALVNLGKVLQAQERPPEALESFLRAAVLDPSDSEAIFLSGQVYMTVGKIQEAVRQFDRVLKNNPRYPRAHVQLGRAALRMSEPKKALEESMAERAVNPDLAEAYVLAAEALFALKQYSRCAAEYQAAVSKRARDAMTLVRMARCYRLAGALDSAQSILRQAEALESGNADLYKEQGAIFHTKGMADEAVAAYDTYLKLVPSANDRAEIESRIRKVQSGDMSVGE